MIDNTDYILKAFGLELKSLKSSDLQMLANWRNDPKVNSFMDYTRKVDSKVLAIWYNMISSSEKNRCFVVYKNKEPIAYFELTDINKELSNCYTGSYLNPEYLNTGNFILVFLLREIVLKEECINDIYTKVRKSNLRSNKIQVELGGVVDSEDDNFYYYLIKKQLRIDVLRKYAKLFDLDDEFDRLIKQ